MRPMLLGKSARKKIILANGMDDPLVNVWDIEAKKIVFTGTRCQIATFLTMRFATVYSALKKKTLLKKKYALRLKSEVK